MGEALVPPLGKSPLDHEVLPFDIAQVAEPLSERLQETRRRSSRRQDTYPPHLPRRLRVGSERRQKDAEGEGDDE